jgi:hypothetical protein
LTNLFTEFQKEPLTDYSPTNRRRFFIYGRPVNRTSTGIVPAKDLYEKSANQSPFQTIESILNTVFEITIDGVTGKDQGISRIVKGIDFLLKDPKSAITVLFTAIAAYFAYRDSALSYFMKKSYLPNVSLELIHIKNNRFPGIASDSRNTAFLVHKHF